MAQILGGTGGTYNQASGVWAGYNGEWVQISTSGGTPCTEFPGPFLTPLDPMYNSPFFFDLGLDLTFNFPSKNNNTMPLVYVTADGKDQYGLDGGQLNAFGETKILQGTISSLIGGRDLRVDWQVRLRATSAAPATLAANMVIAAGALQNTPVATVPISLDVEINASECTAAWQTISTGVISFPAGNSWGWSSLVIPQVASGEPYYYLEARSIYAYYDTGEMILP